MMEMRDAGEMLLNAICYGRPKGERPADESGDALRSCSLRHATAAFPAAQAFDELGHWGARLDPKVNEITLGDDAAVLAAQAPPQPVWIVDKDLPLIQVKDGNVSFCF
jgi:hypothetical protein